MSWFGHNVQDVGSSDVLWSDEGCGDVEEVHTAEHLYCGEVSCWCHTDVVYHEQVTGFSSEVDAQQVERASWFFGLFCKW